MVAVRLPAQLGIAPDPRYIQVGEGVPERSSVRDSVLDACHQRRSAAWTSSSREWLGMAGPTAQAMVQLGSATIASLRIRVMSVTAHPQAHTVTPKVTGR
jgi:hypothetical protein